MPEIPDRLNIDKRDRDLYNFLDCEEILRFKDKGGRRNRKEQFIFAMAYGFSAGARKALGTAEGFVLAKDLHPDDQALIDAVAIYESKSVEILTDQKAVFKIVEEYAHAGVMLLVERIKNVQFGSFEKELEKSLYEILKR